MASSTSTEAGFSNASLQKKGSGSEMNLAPTASTDQEQTLEGKAPGVWATFIGSDRQKLITEPIVWNQGSAILFKSLGARFKAIFTRRFFACLIAGQLLALCITCTSVVTTELGMNNWSLPCSQSFFVYFFLNCFYTPFTIYKYGFPAWGKMLLTDGWKYVILAAIDVEANFLVIKAFQYTDMLSAMLLDAWATPACMIFAFFLVKARYHWSQVVGVLVVTAGMALGVVSDLIMDRNYEASDRVKGDIFMLLGATGYGLSNALEEKFVRQRPLYEVVGQLGMYGMIINAAQGAGLESHLYKENNWDGRTIGLLVAFTCSMLFLYTLAPMLYRLSSSPFYNLSINTSDFWGLCFGLGLFGYRPYWLYFVAFPIVLLGLVIYFSVAKPEESAELNVVPRGKQLVKEQESGKARVIGERI